MPGAASGSGPGLDLGLGLGSCGRGWEAAQWQPHVVRPALSFAAPARPRRRRGRPATLATTSGRRRCAALDHGAGRAAIALAMRPGPSASCLGAATVTEPEAFLKRPTGADLSGRLGRCAHRDLRPGTGESIAISKQTRASGAKAGSEGPQTRKLSRADAEPP